MSVKPITLINGEAIDHISVMDRGLLFGDGVFETMLLINGELPFWALHHERLLKGLVYLGITVESLALRQSIDELIAYAKSNQALRHAEHPLILKVIVTRGQGSRGYTYSPEQQSNLIVQLFPFTANKNLVNGVKVHLCKHRLQAVDWVGLKTLNQLPYVLAAGERQNTDDDEGLLLDSDGALIEATARNIFIVKNETLITPTLEHCGVAGIMRRYIIDELATQIGVKVLSTKLYQDDLMNADEVFLCNSITGIWPVIEYENYQWAVGPITRSLQSMCASTFSF